MKYSTIKSYYNKRTGKKELAHRVYNDFFCTIPEWTLFKDKENFMYQLRKHISKRVKDKYPDQYRADSEECVSLDRTGRRDFTTTEVYSAYIIQQVIKEMTHRHAVVEFYSWKGNIDHVEITFPNSKMPNIIVLFYEYGGLNSTNYTIIECMNAIYDILMTKTTEYYDNNLTSYFNTNYDIICYKSRSNDLHPYLHWRNQWQEKERIRMTKYRTYTNTNISWTKDIKV